MFVAIKSFGIEVFSVLMLFECLKQDTFQRIIFMFQAHLSKGVEKAWNFTKYKSCHKFSDHSLQKHFQTNILESNTAQTLLIVVLMVGLCLDN